MMLTCKRSVSNIRSLPPKICKAGPRIIKRVRFQNDHDGLVKPQPTQKFIFNKNGVTADFVCEHVETPKLRPRKLRFGKPRTLAEMNGETSPDKKSRSIRVTTEHVSPEDIIKKKVIVRPFRNTF